MTDEQHANLPALLREIVELDRDISAMTDGTVVGFGILDIVREKQARRAELREHAHSTYGRVPLRGENGPGRGTAAAARSPSADLTDNGPSRKFSWRGTTRRVAVAKTFERLQ